MKRETEKQGSGETVKQESKAAGSRTKKTEMHGSKEAMRQSGESKQIINKSVSIIENQRKSLKAIEKTKENSNSRLNVLSGG